MLSLRHFFQLIAIIILLSVMFLYLNINNRSEISTESRGQTLAMPGLEDAQLSQEEFDALASPCYVVFSGGEETEQAVFDHVCLFLEKMKVPYESRKYVAESELSPGTLLVFCNTSVAENISEEVLARYVKQGGRALFAAGIPEGYEGAYLSPVWGIVEKGGRQESRRWKVLAGATPAGEMAMQFPDFQASTRIKLDSTARVLIEDEEEKLPILYENSYGEGRSVMINGTLMADRRSGGVFAAAMGALEGELLYPVVGAASVFLEDYPFVVPGYDKNCVKFYGRNAESVQRDILWPVFASYAVSSGLKYTMNPYDPLEIEDVDLLNDRIFTYLVKENLRYSGEVMLTEREDGGETWLVRELLDKHFPNYEPQAYGIVPGNPEGAVRLPEGAETALPIRRQSCAGGGEDCDFGWDGKTVSFPVLSSGYSLGESAYGYLSGLSLYGVISHSIPVGRFIYEEDGKESYEAVREEMGELLAAFGREAAWLEPQTITEAAERVIAYEQVQLRTVSGEDELLACCRGFEEGQRFFLRSERKVSGVDGGSAVEIGDGFWLIEAEKPEFTIRYEQREGLP